MTENDKGKPRGFGRSPFTLQQRAINLAVSVGLGIVVIVLTEQLLWGILAFFVLSVAINFILLKRQGRL